MEARDANRQGDTLSHFGSIGHLVEPHPTASSRHPYLNPLPAVTPRQLPTYQRLPAAAPRLAQATEIAQSRSLLRSRVWLIRVNARAKLKHRGADLIGHFLADLSNQNSIMIATRAFMYKVPRAPNYLICCP